MNDGSGEIKQRIEKETPYITFHIKHWLSTRAICYPPLLPLPTSLRNCETTRLF